MNEAAGGSERYPRRLIVACPLDEELEALFPEVPIVQSNARIGLGKDRILTAIKNIGTKEPVFKPFFSSGQLCDVEDVKCQKLEAEQRLQKIKTALMIKIEIILY